MNISRNITTLMVASTMVGCAANGIPNFITSGYPEHIVNTTEKISFGVPILLSIEGSTVRINNDWVLTSAHNDDVLSLLNIEYIKHDTCDVALAKISGEGSNTFGYVHVGEIVQHVGYPLSMPISINDGTYYGDVVIDSYDYPECVYSVSNGVMFGGMSGGGVFNIEGELVGINAGIIYNFASTDERFADMDGGSVTMFLALPYISGWVNEVTGISLYNIK